MQEVSVPLPVGTVIREFYLIESLLGNSNFGSVYLVRDQRDKQKLFALAELINPDERGEYSFTLEYVSPTPLDDQALPQAQYVFNDDKLGRAYILMSYIEEPNLEILRLQRPAKRFPLPQVMILMAPIINAVTYLHQQRPPLIHRNIKPANIIVPRAVGQSVLVAFSIVKEHNPTTTAVAYFTPGYAATEQYNGECSTRTDIYGLGATFYTLLTGIIPPDALYRSTQLGNKKIDPLEPVNSVVPAIPMHIGKAIERAMSLDAQHRFSSVEQFWEALWLIQADHPAPVFGIPSAPQDSPAVPASKLEQAVGQTIEKPVLEPSPVVPVSFEEQEDQDVEKPPVVSKLDSVEEQEDEDTDKLPVVHVAASIEEQVDLEAEKPLSVGPIPESIEEREDLDDEQPPAVSKLDSIEEQDTDKLPVVHVAASIEEQVDLEAEKPLSIGPIPESIEERDHLDIEQSPPVVPASVEEQEELDVVPVPESIEEQEDLDDEQPPVIPVLQSAEERKDLDIEQPLPVAPVPESIEEQVDLDAEKLLPKLPPVVPIPHSVEEQVDLDAEKPSTVVPVPHSVEEQEAKTNRLASLPQIYLKRWLSYLSLKNNNHSGRSQGSSPSLQDVKAPTQPISFHQEEIASKNLTEKSASPPEDSSPIEPPESRVTDVSTEAEFAQRSLADQNGRIDQGSLWPGMDIEMSFSQSDWEWSVSSRRERDRQEE